MTKLHQIGLGAFFVAIFIGLSLFGINVKLETKPEVASASTVQMMTINGSHSNVHVASGTIVTVVWSAPAGYNYCNTGVSPNPLAGWGSYIDKPTSGSYSVTVHQSMRFQLQCAQQAPGPMTIEDGVSVDVNSSPTIACSTNAQCGSVTTSANVCSSNSVYKNVTTPTCNNPGTTASVCANVVTQVLQQNCSTNQTCSAGVCVNPGTVACNTNTDCGTNGYSGSPTCQGNSIYRNYVSYTCMSPGTTASYCATPLVTNQFQSNCGANQTCSAGVCVNQGTGACNTNADCGSTSLGGLTCQGNSIYRTQTTPICNNPGTSISSCSFPTTQQFQSNCSANQTCSGGSCTGGGSIACNSNFDCGGSGLTGANFCQGNAVYRNYTTYTCVNPGTTNSYCGSPSVYAQLQNSCYGNQVCSYGSCINDNVNTCTYHSYQQCSNNAVYWYSSCGVQQDLIQTCSAGSVCSNNTCTTTQNNSNITTNTLVRNLSNGNLSWTSSVSASPGDIVQYQVTVQSFGNQYSNNIIVRETFPNNLYYKNSLTLNGVSNSGDITQGINIGSLSNGQSAVITYQAQVAPAQNFAFGTTTLSDLVSVTGGGYNANTSSAPVVVTRSGVLGATDVSTGLTNYFWVDSFFLPLILALLGLWAYKAGLLNSFGIASWIGNKRTKNNEMSASAKLQNKIAQIKNREIA